jgi:hypothetical protein
VASSLAAPASHFFVVKRTWTDGDTLTLKLPMRVSVRRWSQNKDSVSVDYGPLTFALAIKERWEKYGDRNPNWPEWEVFPESPWNYGLVLDAADPAKSFAVIRKPGPLASQPFTPETAPIEIKAKARKIPDWQTDRLNMVGKLQQSPARTSEPEETVTLIPMGAARLRIASFPTASTGPEGNEWVAPPKPKLSLYRASASHVFGNDTVEALGDGLEPANSNDHGIPRFTWWSHRGSKEWVQFDFGQPRKVSSIAVYWFDDTGAGQCRVPQSARLLCKAGDAWQPVEGAGQIGVERDAWNRVSFPALETTALRIEVQLKSDFSGGILEWKVE